MFLSFYVINTDLNRNAILKVSKLMSYISVHWNSLVFAKMLKDKLLTIEPNIAEVYILFNSHT